MMKLIVGIAVAMLAGIAGASAQGYPNRPITVVVPFAAGGVTDIVARIVTDRMKTALGQAVVVENQGGAGGTIATRQVAKSEPDGATLLIATSSLAINPSLYPNVGYDPRKDFAPIALCVMSPYILSVNPAVPARTIQELIALAKAKPGQLNYASAGNGTGPHLAGEMLKNMAKIDIVHG